MELTKSMPSSKNLKIKCAYCGASEKVTDDHIPPKNLFPKPRPNDLIKVPACNKCHSGTSKDDEYFRLKVCMNEDVKTHSAIETVTNTVFSSLLRKEAIGLRKQVLSDTRWFNIRTNSGIYIGKRLGYYVDRNRINRVVERITRGLYYFEVGKPLGLGNDVRVFSDNDIKSNTTGVIEQFKQDILRPLSTCKPKVIGNGIFSYRFQTVEENPVFSVWLLVFYGGFSFLAMTKSK